MSILADNCKDMRLDPVLMSRLFELIDSFAYTTLDSTSEEKELYNRRFSNKFDLVLWAIVKTRSVKDATLNFLVAF